jgi:nucleoid DNA-binding protein
MNKSELIEKIASGADISKAAAGRALDSFIAAVTEGLKVLVHLKYVNVLNVLAVTHKRVKKLKLLLRTFQRSKLAKR